MTDFKNLGKELKKMSDDARKKVRRACYLALENTAEQSRNAIIANYPKKFKDENGIRKNKGVPKQTSKTKVDKQKLSISLNWGQKRNLDFMDDQEFGGTRTGLNGASRAVPTLETRQKGRTASGKMKQSYDIKNLMSAAARAETERSKSSDKPKPFFMITRSGHHMLVRRRTKARNSTEILYHFDKKVQIRPRFDFVKTVEGVTVHNIEKNFIKELEKIMTKK